MYVYDNIQLAGNDKVECGLNLPFYNYYTEQQVGDTLLYAMNLYGDRASMSAMISFSMLGVLYRCFKETGYAPRFILFLNGKTGSIKTTVGKILFTQIAQDNFRDVPRRIDADTCVSFERAVVLGGRDTTTLIDDYSPAKTARKKGEMQDKLETIIRMVGDGSSKSRSNVQLEDCRGEGVQGVVVLTGELAGKGVSSNLRCLYCKMQKGKVDVNTVTWFQNNPYAYTTVIASMANYVAENWSVITGYIRNSFDDERRRVSQFLNEPRVIDSAVTLRIVSDIIGKFLIQFCKKDELAVKTLVNEMKNSIITNAVISQEMSTQEDYSVLL